jgi:small subunit ribosomal protein S16
MTTLLTCRASVASTSGLRASPVVRTIAPRSPLQVEARVHIRFSRFGRKKAPVYRIIAIDSRKRRDGRPLQWLGYYDPISKAVSLDAPNIKKWLSHGAQPSESVGKLLKKAMVIDS